MSAKHSIAKLSQVEKAAASLTGIFGLKVELRKASKFGEEIILQNQVAGIKIRHSKRDGQGLHALVGKLVMGEFPGHPGSIDDETRLDSFDVRDVALIRINNVSGPVAEKIRKGSPLNDRDIKLLIQGCCSDVLNGNFAVFALADQVVKDRARRLTQEYPTGTDRGAEGVSLRISAN
jgi:hypothetical protein